MIETKKDLLYKQIILLSKIQQLLYNHLFMTEKNMKLMDEDKYHLLPDFYKEPILKMRIPIGLSQKQLIKIGANQGDESLKLYYSEIEEQINRIRKLLNR